MKCSNFNHFFRCEFGITIIFSSWRYFASLLYHFSNVFQLSASAKVFGVTAFSICDARVKDQLAVLYVSIVFVNQRNPACLKRMRLAQECYGEFPITPTIKSGSPRPTFIWVSFFNLCPEKLSNVLREYLIQKFGRYRLWPHKLVCLICAALSGEPTPRGQFHFNEAA